MNPNNAARSSASGGLNIIATAQIPGFTTAQQPTHATDLTTEGAARRFSINENDLNNIMV